MSTNKKLLIGFGIAAGGIACMLCPLLIPAELEAVGAAVAAVGGSIAGAGITVMITTIVNKEN